MLAIYFCVASLPLLKLVYIIKSGSCDAFLHHRISWRLEGFGANIFLQPSLQHKPGASFSNQVPPKLVGEVILFARKEIVGCTVSPSNVFPWVVESPLWRPTQICWMCRASKGAEDDMDLCFTNASNRAGFWETYMDTDPWSEDPPYSQLDGFHLSMVIPDLLHVVNMGVGRDLCGSILKSLVQENHVFNGTIDEKLAEATQSLRSFARAEGLPLRLRKFSKKN